MSKRFSLIYILKNHVLVVNLTVVLIILFKGFDVIWRSVTTILLCPSMKSMMNISKSIYHESTIKPPGGEAYLSWRQWYQL